MWTEGVTWYVMCWHYRSLALQRSCAFGKTVKEYSIDSTLRIELSCTNATCRGHGWGHVQGLGHVQGSCGKGLRAGSMQITWDDLHLQMGGVQQCRLKHRCQLVVRLKAIECYKKLLSYLSSSTSGLLFIAVTALFIAILLGFQEVERRRHSPLNPFSLRQITW